ncbi:MAG: SdrD B-like domain-containing protein, partial [Planctomycetota bacterium]
LIRQIVLPAGGDGIDYDFCEGSPASVEGVVYHDRSNDGIRDDNEEPIANVTLTLIDEAGQTVGTTTTDPQGRYRFDNLSPGTYSVRQTQPSGYLDGIDSVGTIGSRTVGQIGPDGDSLTQIQLKQGEQGLEYDFGELQSASLAGRVHLDLDEDCVFDADEQPLSGVVIRLLDQAGNEVAVTTSDSQGQYRFDNLAPGTYTVVEETPSGLIEGGAKAGTSGGRVIDPNRIGSINLTSGQVAIDYDFCERPPAEIAGRVFADRDGDCIVDEGEPGIAGVLVELFDTDGNLVGSTETDASGRYRFSDLPAGNYMVRETQPAGYLQGGQRAGSHGGNDLVADQISAIPIGWGDRLTEYNFCELEPASISGTVYVDHNSDCIRQPDEPGLAGVRIDLRDASGQLITFTSTDAQGRYQFDDLAPGDYQVFEHQPDGLFHGGQTPGTGSGRVLGQDLLATTMLTGDALTGYDFCELQPASLSGYVWSETDLNQRFDPGDDPLARVVIELIDRDGEVISTTRTDANGQYRFEGLRPDTYGVRQQQPAAFFHGGEVVGDQGGQIVSDDHIGQIVLPSGAQGARYNFPEVPPATISGYVFQDGEALELGTPPDPQDLRQYRDGVLTPDDERLGGVVLELRSVLGLPFSGDRALPGEYPDGPIRVTTDADGYYEFTGLRPGSYHVYQVQPDHYVDGLDTAGSRGGVAVNPADQLNDETLIQVQTLAASDATDPRDDAILNIALAAGSVSELNNFSEIVVVPVPDPPVPPPPIPPAPETPDRLAGPIETFDTAVRVVAYAEPISIQQQPVFSDEWAVSWHLSVINAGFTPDDEVPSSTMRQASVRRARSMDWPSIPLAKGKWSIGQQLRPRGTNAALRNETELAFGCDDCVPLTGDFNGDGQDEVAVYHGGQWFVDLNGNGRWDEGDLWIRMGTMLDRPVIGDWDGDGKDDIAIFGRQWERDPQRIRRDPGLPDPDNTHRRDVPALLVASKARKSSESTERMMQRSVQGDLHADVVDHVFQYGEQGDTPLAGDWNGDGIDQIAVFRGGTWLLDHDGDGRRRPGEQSFQYGRPGDQPVVGDFNGDGIDEIGIVRGDTWIIDTDGDHRLTGNDLQIRMKPTSQGATPIVGDFNGDGKDEPGYYDEAA